MLKTITILCNIVALLHCCFSCFSDVVNLATSTVQMIVYLLRPFIYFISDEVSDSLRFAEKRRWFEGDLCEKPD